MTSKRAIDYDSSKNRHTVTGAEAALGSLLKHQPAIASLLDVGCGPGTWIEAASKVGIAQARGIDGNISDELVCRANAVEEVDLTTSWSLGRRFDLVLCLEVGEHLPSESAVNLLECLCAHGDEIFFSAAIPGQGGQHHVNCQWPEYWQRLFNQQGFACYDDLRWRIWDNEAIEPWYRQNLFRARRNPAVAGEEARIPSVVHPVMLDGMILEHAKVVSELKVKQIEAGSQKISWYPLALVKALWSKVLRHARSAPCLTSDDHPIAKPSVS